MKYTVIMADGGISGGWNVQLFDSIESAKKNIESYNPTFGWIYDVDMATITNNPDIKAIARYSKIRQEFYGNGWRE